MQLITTKEKEKEKQAVEKYLGVNRSQPKSMATTAKPEPATEKNATQNIPHEAMPVARVATPTLTAPKPEVVESKVEIITAAPLDETAPESAPAPQPLIPNVSSPF